MILHCVFNHSFFTTLLYARACAFNISQDRRKTTLRCCVCIPAFYLIVMTTHFNLTALSFPQRIASNIVYGHAHLKARDKLLVSKQWCSKIFILEFSKIANYNTRKFQYHEKIDVLQTLRSCEFCKNLWEHNVLCAISD